MEDQCKLQELFPAIYDDQKLLSSFLAKHQLKYEEDIEYAIGLCENGNLLACGCCSGTILKCFAVEEKLRGSNVLGKIVSALVSNRFSAGYYEPIVITPPYNRELFIHCGFHPVLETKNLVFLEFRSDGIERFAEVRKKSGDEGKTAGAIVVNCNPFTKGHRYLVEYAAARCELLHIFVVEEDRSIFPFAVRLKLVQEGVADLPNVRVSPGGNYIISAATFPTYFLKKEDDAVEMQARLDAALFAYKIAPLLSIKKRFVGSEPKCVVTNKYNQILHEIMPEAGIELEEIPRRMTSEGEVISASRVRQLLAQGVDDHSLLKLVPETTYKYLISPEAAEVVAALQQQVK